MMGQQTNNDLIGNLIDNLCKLPSIGKKSAQRLAYFLLNHDEQKVENLANAILNARKNIKKCTICYNYAEEEFCPICLSASQGLRQTELICVIEKPSDILLLEKFGGYRGVYHVLGGTLSPLDGIGPANLTINSLISRLHSLDSPELVFALNTNTDGEATVMYLINKIKSLPVKISRLARGMPIGSDLQYIDEITMQKALENRVLL
ncbi:MAG: recombination protein RecR [Fibrobacteria bacterium]|nr:recombination protein RecR [Fibrobacteria bacterium]